MKITYLFHSGFMVEMDHHVFLFDYFKDNCKKSKYRDCGQVKGEDLPKDKHLYVFVSHSHCDHYSKEIYDLNRDNVSYIVFQHPAIQKEGINAYRMEPYQTLELDDIKIHAYGSTDEGLSFLVEAEGKTLFHGGDLNWWHWTGESEEERAYARQVFMDEMSKIPKVDMDVAMFAVDPRLEEAFSYGGEYFINHFHPKVFIPMHFQDTYSVTNDFAEVMKDTDTQVVEIHSRGEIVYEK